MLMHSWQETSHGIFRLTRINMKLFFSSHPFPSVSVKEFGIKTESGLTSSQFLLNNVYRRKGVKTMLAERISFMIKGSIASLLQHPLNSKAVVVTCFRFRANKSSRLAFKRRFLVSMKFRFFSWQTQNQVSKLMKPHESDRDSKPGFLLQISLTNSSHLVSLLML